LDVNSFGTATLTGKMLISRGGSSQPKAPFHMSEEDFIVSVDYSSFKINNSGRYILPIDKDRPRIKYFKENGEFIINVPVGNGLTTVYLDFSDFSDDAITENTEVIWKASSHGTDVRVLPGQYYDLGMITISTFIP